MTLLRVNAAARHIFVVFNMGKPPLQSHLRPPRFRIHVAQSHGKCPLCVVRGCYPLPAVGSHLTQTLIFAVLALVQSFRDLQ
jgi:hypothetical protein